MRALHALQEFNKSLSTSEMWLMGGVTSLVLWMGIIAPLVLWIGSSITGDKGMVGQLRSTPGLGCMFAVVCLIGGPFLLYPGILALFPVLGLSLLRLLTMAMTAGSTTGRR